MVYSSVTALEAKLGGIKLGGQLNSSDGRLTVTTNADGTVDRVASARYGDVGIAVTSKADANGDPVGTATRSLLLHDVDESMVEGLVRATGEPAGATSAATCGWTSPSRSSSSCARSRSPRWPTRSR